MSLNKLDKRFYYRLEILYNKYAPAFVALVITLDNFCGIEDNYIHSLSYFCLPSVLTMLHMYISRSVLQFCRLHRIIVNYVFVNILYRIWQDMPALPQWDNKVWNGIYVITFLVGLMSFLYNYVTSYKKTTP